MNFLQMSFAGTMMIIAIIIIRVLFINRLPKKTFLILWGIVLVRLMVPFSLPSTFSVYMLFRRNASAMVMLKNTPMVKLLPSASVNHRAGVSPTVLHISDTFSVWTVIWAMGVFGVIFFFIITYWKCRKEFRIALPIHNDFVQCWLNAHQLKRRISIQQSGRISTPLTYGIFSPVILIPNTVDWENTKTLQYVLAHEYVHIQRMDAILKLILATVLCVHWFNPFVWIMYILANRDIELSCDETVVRLFGECSKSEYARTLISMEEAKGNISSLYSSFSKNAIEERITAIMKIKRTTAFSISLAFLIVTLTTTVFATSADSIDEPTLDFTDAAMTETALKRLENNYPDVARWVRKCYPDTIWWTYEGYQQMMETERKNLEASMGQTIGSTPSTGEIIVTPDLIENQMADYEQTLNDIESGIMFSKSMAGDENLGGSFDPAEITAGSSIRELQCSIKLKDGTEKIFGPYDNEEDMLTVVKPFCDEQVKLGNMEQGEADEIISKYSGN